MTTARLQILKDSYKQQYTVLNGLVTTREYLSKEINKINAQLAVEQHANYETLALEEAATQRANQLIETCQNHQKLLASCSNEYRTLFKEVYELQSQIQELTRTPLQRFQRNFRGFFTRHNIFDTWPAKIFAGLVGFVAQNKGVMEYAMFCISKGIEFIAQVGAFSNPTEFENPLPQADQCAYSPTVESGYWMGQVFSPLFFIFLNLMLAHSFSKENSKKEVMNPEEIQRLGM